MQAKKNHFILSIVKLSFYLQKLYETSFSLLHGVGVTRCLTFSSGKFYGRGIFQICDGSETFWYQISFNGRSRNADVCIWNQWKRSSLIASPKMLNEVNTLNPITVQSSMFCCHSSNKLAGCFSPAMIRDGGAGGSKSPPSTFLEEKFFLFK